MRKSIILLVLGTAILTYGITRHLIVLEMIEKCSNYLCEYQMEVSDTGIPDVYWNKISRDLSSINEKIALSHGPYEWLDGMIWTTAIACSCFFASYYYYRRCRVSGDAARQR